MPPPGVPNAGRAPARIVGLALAVAIAPQPVAADEAQAWTLDPVHTRVLVSVSHAGFSQALGTVSGSEGVLLFDPQDWRSARLDVSVPLARLDFGDQDWNRAVLARRLLDAGQYPAARFVSDSATALAPDRAEVCGALTLRGVTRPVCLEVRLNSAARHPMPPFRRTAGFSASTTLSRSAFGIDAWPSMIGDEVQLRIEAEAVRADRTKAAAQRKRQPASDAADGSNPAPPPVTAETAEMAELADAAAAAAASTLPARPAAPAATRAPPETAGTAQVPPPPSATPSATTPSAPLDTPPSAPTDAPTREPRPPAFVPPDPGALSPGQ